MGGYNRGRTYKGITHQRESVVADITTTSHRRSEASCLSNTDWLGAFYHFRGITRDYGNNLKVLRFNGRDKKT